ncbi:threonine aldolase family protein [Caproiciproducens faecalis]|uniref:Aminotransferase class I/II-fold pyridoxal phosphate-dependent enzyme n=1 Tax=Caproiciproducens faecalis TaxID=2820301 RepID=A0ABS7DT20_9FIRM|nr:aminotransferase class I/II-fold pyridoxal phosphate-dependent enzyme [Caproiciproducens faecalis]MBW7573965.1 aminotransferase class I/II-fold pyridoxal phosphate-dependent enzyme [Caproiciproducens faecalis]
MYRFNNDYSEGAHPRILEALAEASREQNAVYGNDRHSQHAAELIRQRIGRNDVAVHFLEGGTQTNLTAISAFLRPYQAAVAAETGHINVHETGAIEATGHKVLTVHTENGLLTPEMVQKVLDEHTDEHMVSPKLVYVSDSTEIGTIYTKTSLTALSKFCKANQLYLYLDGARLGSALTSEENDLTLQDLADLTDAFYIGGTKNGVLFGEALVICNPELKADFRFMQKQRGAITAKGMVLGVQFEVLFQDNLYFDLASHANRMADLIRSEIEEAGFSFLSPSPTNQIFPILPNSLIEKLKQKYGFEFWAKIDESASAIRLVTSWATPESEVEAFIKDFHDFVQ